MEGWEEEDGKQESGNERKQHSFFLANVFFFVCKMTQQTTWLHVRINTMLLCLKLHLRRIQWGLNEGLLEFAGHQMTDEFHFSKLCVETGPSVQLEEKHG